MNVDRPLLRVPTLAIHLDREISTKGFQFNTETALRPVLATAVKEQLMAPLPPPPGEAGSGGGSGACSTAGAHHPALLRVLADELGCRPDDIAVRGAGAPARAPRSLVKREPACLACACASLTCFGV